MGQGENVIATLEINMSNHFGRQFEEATYRVSAAQNGKALQIGATKIKVSLKPVKEKKAEVFEACVRWRQE